MSKRSSGKENRYDLENSIGYLLNRAAHLIAARFGDDLKKHGVTLQAWRILAALSQAENQSMSALANHTGAELSYLSRSIVTLEEQGLVERSPSPLDKRAIQLSLTADGWIVMRELAPKGRAMDRLSVQDVPEADLQATLRTLRAMAHNLVADANAPSPVNRKLTIARRVRQRARSLDAEPVPRRRVTA